LRFNTFSAGLEVVSLASTSCDNFRRVENGACADACIPEKLGICGRSTIVRLGKLKPGTCADAGFSIPSGTLEQAAGPCGTLTFNTFSAGLEAASFGTLSFEVLSFEVFDDAEW